MIQSSIIDCHTHPYPPEVIAAPRIWAKARGEHHWADLVAPKNNKSIQGWSNTRQMISSMDAARVNRAVLLGWYWTKESSCRWHNEIIAQWTARDPKRFIAFAAIYPNENVIDQLESAKSMGFSGVGELHTGVQDFKNQSKHWLTMARWCARSNWPINFHVTDASRPMPANAVLTPIQTFVEIAEAEPNLKMILAHLGGELPQLERDPKLSEILRNVYYDSAASPLLYDISYLKKMLHIVGADKLLFGSDYPLKIYPKQEKIPEMTRFLRAIIDQSGFSSDEKRNFLGGNFQKLLKN